MLDKVKAWVGILDNGRDELIQIIIGTCRSEILAYTNRTDEQWLDCFDSILLHGAVMTYNRLGAEGETSRAEGGVSVSFGADSGFLGMLDRYRLARVVI